MSTIEVSDAPELKARAKDRWNLFEATPCEVNALVTDERSVIANTTRSRRGAMVMGGRESDDNDWCEVPVVGETVVHSAFLLRPVL